MGKKMKAALTSSAAGAYQLTKDTWDDAAKALDVASASTREEQSEVRIGCLPGRRIRVGH